MWCFFLQFGLEFTFHSVNELGGLLDRVDPFFLPPAVDGLAVDGYLKPFQSAVTGADMHVARLADDSRVGKLFAALKPGPRAQALCLLVD
jgi:hypothetical protein